MHHTILTLLACILTFTCNNLNAQEVSSETPEPSNTEVEVQNTEVETQVSKAKETVDSTSDVTAETPEEDLSATEAQASDEPEDMIQAIDAEANELTLDDDETEDLEEGEDAEEEEEEEAPVFVSVDEDGRLIGLVTAIVTGEYVPIEANVSLVRDGVLLSKIVANEDGSFAFPNVGPGEYNMYGSASSYCGRQAFTVIPPSQTCTVCDDSVSLRLTQYSEGGCYTGLSGAPAASFSGGGGSLSLIHI